MTDSNLQTQLNIALQNRINEYIRTVGTLQQSNQWLQKENQRLQQELAQLKGQAVRPAAPAPAVQAPAAGADPRRAVDEQQLLLGEWMVSQKAFKALAIELGQQQGWAADRVIAEGQARKLKVLNDEHPDGHGTNASGIPLLVALKAALLQRLQDKKA